VQKQTKRGVLASRECPNCHSQKFDKCGFRETRKGSVQKFLCQDCGYRFSESSSLSMKHSKNAGRQISVTLTEGTKNLTEVETRTRKALRESTHNTTRKNKLKEIAINFSWQLKRYGYVDSTIETYSYLIQILVKRGADLSKPDSIKDVIAKQNSWSNGRKNNAVKAYSLYVKMNGLSWEKPKYKTVEKSQFIPNEKQIDLLMSGCCTQMATFLQVLKETASRRGEAFNLKWEDVDFVNNRIKISPEKGSKPRIFKMSPRLVTMLNNLPRTKERIWIYTNVFYLDKGFRRMRKKTAHKLGQPQLNKITFHTLRRWKATIEYARTKDHYYVRDLLGHRSVATTERNIQCIEIPS
jgi:integrase